MSIVGKNLKELRKKYKLTQEEFAKKCSISKNAIWSYENGVSSPSIEILENIAQQFDVSIIELLLNPVEDVEDDLQTHRNEVRERTKLLKELRKQYLNITNTIENAKKEIKLTDEAMEKVLLQQLEMFLLVAQQYTSNKDLNIKQVTKKQKVKMLKSILEYLERCLIQIYFENNQKTFNKLLNIKKNENEEE